MANTEFHAELPPDMHATLPDRGPSNWTLLPSRTGRGRRARGASGGAPTSDKLVRGSYSLGMRRLALLLVVLGCGGRATERPGGASLSGAGGAPTTSSGTAGAPAGGAGTLDPVLARGGAADEPPPPLPTCATPAPACGIAGRSYISIEDGPSVTQLSVPIDTACAACGVPCEDCESACEIYATGTASCGDISLELAVCAGEAQTPPCLNTLRGDRYYVEANGKRWSVDALSGIADLTTYPSVLDVDLTLELRDGAVTRSLPAHARVCAGLTAVLRPCK